MKRQRSAASPSEQAATAARQPRAYGKILIALVAALAFLIYAGALWRNACYVAGGADSSGYLNSARALSRGASVQPMTELDDLQLPDDYTWAFVPLGFTAGPVPHTVAPTYPPGVPLMMAAAALVGGWDRAPFLLSALAALLCLPLTYALGREFGLSTSHSLAAAAVFGLCPTTIFHAIQPLSDVIAAFWCLVTIVCCLRSQRTSPNWAVAAGAAFGMAVLVRPNNLLLLPAIAAALPLRPKHASRFVAGGLPFAGFLALYNAHNYGGATQTGYGSLVGAGLLAWGHFPPRLKHYVTEVFLQLSPLLPPAWAAALIFVRSALPPRRRLLLFVWPLAYLLFYCFYAPHETWWYLRFLLPALPPVVVGGLLWWQEAGRPFVERRAAFLPPAAATTVGVLLLAGVIAAQAYQIWHYRIFEYDESQHADYVETARSAGQSLPPRAFVLSMQASGALRYYTNLRVVRYDTIDAEKFATVLTRVAARGDSLYALLFPWEEPAARGAVRGRWRRLANAPQQQAGLWAVDPPLDFGVGRDEVMREIDDLLSESGRVPPEVLSFVKPAEFERKSFYVYKFYKVALGRAPTYDEIAADLERFGAAAGEAVALEQAEFADEWVRRAEHRLHNPDGRPDGDFVDELEQRAGVKLSGIDQLVAGLNSNGANGANARARTLQRIVESEEVSAEFYNEAFVAAQYYGFLRRAPDAEGMKNWLKLIDADAADARRMVRGFLDSVEYRRRFGGR